jgi:hypothetical protein
MTVSYLPIILVRTVNDAAVAQHGRRSVAQVVLLDDTREHWADSHMGVINRCDRGRSEKIELSDPLESLHRRRLK